MKLKFKLTTLLSLLFLGIFLTAVSVNNSYAGASKGNSYLSNIQVLGTIVTSYTYNLAKPDGYNGNYGDNWQSAGFTVNNADITIRRSPGTPSDPYGIGFHISLDFGQNIQFYKAYYGGTSYFDAFQKRAPYDVRKAYININLPIGSGLDVHIGKESELLGFESFNPIRSWNNTYSLLTAAEPATLTGIFLTYNFIPSLTSTLGVANTINSVNPIDSLPVIELNENYALSSALTVNGGFIYGANSYIVDNGTVYKDDLNKSLYSYIDAQYSPTDNWSFVLDYELGLGGGVNRSVYTKNNLTPPTPVRATYGKSRFDGVAAYIHHQRNYSFGQVAETVREVWAHDHNGLWEGTSTSGTGYTYVGSTLTLAYTPALKEFKDIQLRLELEHQMANHSVYNDANGLQTHAQQNTINLMVLYKF